MEHDKIIIDRVGREDGPDIRLMWERNDKRPVMFPENGWSCYRQVEGRGWVRLQSMDARTDIRLGEQISAFVSHQLPSIMLISLATHALRA
jgi:hypothetical protein